MTIGFLQTARLNATPLSKHLDTPEQAQPVYTCMDTLLADMLEDARQIRKRSGMKKIGKSQTTAEDILAVIAENPGETVEQISNRLARSATAMRSRLNRLQADGQIRYQMRKRGTTRYRVFFVNEGAPAPTPPKRGRPKLDQAIAFMRNTPGCTVADLAEHMGINVKTAAKYTMEARKMFDVSVEHGTGNTPARYWIEGDA